MFCYEVYSEGHNNKTDLTKEVVWLKINEDNFIKEMKKGNEKSLLYVIDNYGWILKTVIKKHLFYLPNYYDEVMNDCLLAIWENINSYDSEKSSFKNWVGSIAKYNSIDYIRKYLKDRETRDINDMIIVDEESPLKEILANEINEETDKMLMNLSEEDRRIFEMLYFEQKSMDEISEKTGHTKPVLYNRLSRGRNKIRDTVNIEGGHTR